MVKNVIFDFGGVLLDWDLRYLFAKLIDDPQELDWFLANVITKEWHFNADKGTALTEMVAARCSEFPDHTHLIEAYAARFNETIPGTIAGTPEIITELAARNVPLFGITNFGSEFFAGYRPAQPLFTHFQDIVVSGDEKLHKPDPAIYALAMRRFGIEPASAIFIDDNLANAESAREFGLNTHHFTAANSLRSELTRLGLLG